MKQFLKLIFSLAFVMNVTAYAGETSAYFDATYANLKNTQEKLEKAGFNIVAVTKVDKKGKYNSVVFTNKMLKATADQKSRGFIATMKILVDDENKKVRITNPDYFARAYMQSDYKEGMLKNITDALKKEFGPFKDSIDKLATDSLEKYHFMFGMPYYEDLIELAKGESAELIAKAEKKAKKSHLFTLKISEKRYLIGVDLKKRTKKFVKKIGIHNGAILPYTILIEDGKAVAMAPKYYIALSYPLLSMNEFTTIATVPGAIEKELSKLFK